MMNEKAKPRLFSFISRLTAPALLIHHPAFIIHHFV
jgi:hypothetical protein